MDGKGLDDNGLGDRYSDVNEPAEIEDPASLHRPGYEYVVPTPDDGPLTLPTRPHDTKDISQYRAMVDDSAPDSTPPPATYPGNGYAAGGSSEAGYGDLGNSGNGDGSGDRKNDYGRTEYGWARYRGNAEHGETGSGSDSHSGNGSGGNGYGGDRYGDAKSGGAIYRSRARQEAQSQPDANDLDQSTAYPSGHSHPAAVGRASPYRSDPDVGDGHGAVGLYERSTAEQSAGPAYSLTEDLAELRRRDAQQRRQEARRAEEADGDERKQMPLWQELPLLLVVAFCVAVLIRSFLVQAFFIPSSSMEQTLLVGDRVLVNKILYDVRAPERGEVVVFRGTDRWAPENFSEQPGSMLDRIGETLGDLVGVSRPGEKDFIKRVIGLPGDRVECCDNLGRVMVNGVGIDEPYINVDSSLDVPPTAHCGARRFTEVVVPDGHLFVMGDNRAVSQDSRCQGTVPIENVIGRAFMIVWPSGRWDTLTVPDSFDAVPTPTAVGPSAPVRPDPPVSVVTLPMLASLVGSSGLCRKRRSPTRRLRR